MLVAEQFRRGRLFIAGDAAHLFTPTGGMGYNTSVDDVVNLGWKLAAVAQGWAGETLLDSYYPHGLCLDGGVPAWSVSAEGMQQVIEFIEGAIA